VGGVRGREGGLYGKTVGGLFIITLMCVLLTLVFLSSVHGSSLSLVSSTSSIYSTVSLKTIRSISVGYCENAAEMHCFLLEHFVF